MVGRGEVVGGRVNCCVRFETRKAVELRSLTLTQTFGVRVMAGESVEVN
jgi:hypothetical protein